MALWLTLLPCFVTWADAQIVAAPRRTKYHAWNHAEGQGKLTPSGSLGRVEVVPRGEGLVLRVTPDPKQPRSSIEREIYGHYMMMQDREWYGLHVLDVDHDGIDEIVTLTLVGASLGAVLGIWKVRDDQPVELTDGRAGGSQFTIEEAPDGSYRVKCYGRWTNRQTSTLDIFEWNGKEFRSRRVEGVAKRTRIVE